MDLMKILGGVLGGGQETPGGGMGDALSGLSGGMAESLGYKNMAMKRKNGPPVQQLLPSQAAQHGVMRGVHEAMQPTVGAMGGMPDLSKLMSFHAQGGKLNPRKVNIVGENGPEAVVGDEVIPLPQDYAPVADDQGNSAPVRPSLLNSPPVQQLLGGSMPQGDGDGPDMEPDRDEPRGYDYQQGTPTGLPAEDDYAAQIQQTLKERTKRSPWADLGVSLVQAGDNWFNHKNEPIKTWAEMKADRKLGSLMPQYKIQQDKIASDRQNKALDAKISYDEAGRRIQDDVLGERREAHQTDAQLKAQKMKADDANLKMRLVARQWENLGAYDPTNPKFAELTKQMQDVGLPITAKDAKKNIKFEQDAETGAWYTTLTDPTTGEQETREVTQKDGKQLVTTSSSKVMSNAAGERQTSAQRFSAGENEKDRAQRKEQFLLGYQNTVTNQLKSFADDAAKTAQWKQEQILRIQKDLKDGAIDKDTADGLLAIIAQN